MSRKYIFTDDTCHGNNTTFNQTNPQNNNQGLNNFFVPFPYGRE